MEQQTNTSMRANRAVYYSLDCWWADGRATNVGKDQMATGLYQGTDMTKKIGSTSISTVY